MNGASAHGTVAVLDGTGGVGKTSLVTYWAHRSKISSAMERCS
ncbi:hypothetical protein [Amycolatopsis sp. WAC 01376]|nr:hypothetical protein [Amycolatopsis sp. WAC 01376]